MMDDTTDTDEPDDLLSATLDVAAYPDPDELAHEALRRMRVHGSLVIVDRGAKTFDGFLIHWWRGVYVVRGTGQRALGTFASIEAAISRGRTAPRDDGTVDDDADALA